MTAYNSSRILLVEDDPAHARLVVEFLRGTPCENCRLHHVSSLKEAFAALATESFDLVLLDLGLPESRGVETFKTFKRKGFDLPIVVLTSLADEALALEALNLGAEDYLGKDEMAGNLCRTIRHAIERSALTRDLRVREHQLSTIFNHTLDGLAVIALDGTVLLGNPVAQTVMTSITPAEILQDVDRSRHTPFLREIALEASGDQAEEIYELVGKTGAWDETPACIVSFRNITLRRQLEQHMHQAQKLEMVGTLASSIAHDFNNVLTIALGHGQVAQTMVGDDDPVRESIDLVIDAVKRGEFLVRDLMHFSRPTPGERYPFNLVDLVRKTERLIGKNFQKTHRFTVSYSTDEAIVKGSSQKMEQVLLNLLFNARDATPSQGAIDLELDRFILPRVQNFTNLEAPPGDYLRLQVRDNGHGIDPGLAGRVFEPFYTTKAAGKGTGLGLFIVYSIVTEHNGYVRCLGRPGTGTTFEILLPSYAAA